MCWVVRVTKTAGKLSKQTFTLPSEVKGHRMHNKEWRLATAAADDVLITFDTPHQADIELLKLHCSQKKTVLELKTSLC